MKLTRYERLVIFLFPKKVVQYLITNKYDTVKDFISYFSTVRLGNVRARDVYLSFDGLVCNVYFDTVYGTSVLYGRCTEFISELLTSEEGVKIIREVISGRTAKLS